MNNLFPITRFGGVNDLDREFDSIYKTFFGDMRPASRRRTTIMTTPRANTLKTDEGYQIEMAAPGFSRDDFDINVDNGVLNISISSEDTQEYMDQLMSQEYSLSSFSRSWTLPEGASIENIDARYEAGILNLFIPVAGKNAKSLVIDVK